MPPINQYKCNTCEFTLPSGWCGIAYVESYEGDRVKLHHPHEYSITEKVLNFPEGTLQDFWSCDKTKWWWSKKRKDAFKKNRAMKEIAWSRTGFLSDCICIDCMGKQSLDLEKDKRECRFCSSENVKSSHELLGNLCPKCKDGRIEEIETGVWT